MTTEEYAAHNHVTAMQKKCRLMWRAWVHVKQQTGCDLTEFNRPHVRLRISVTAGKSVRVYPRCSGKNSTQQIKAFMWEEQRRCQNAHHRRRWWTKTAEDHIKCTKNPKEIMIKVLSAGQNPYKYMNYSNEVLLCNFGPFAKQNKYYL